MKEFFGEIYIICCSTGSKDTILHAGSYPGGVKIIQMGPSKELFIKMAGEKYRFLLDNLFFHIVYNRRCAVYAADAIKSLQLTDAYLSVEQTSEDFLNKTQPVSFANYLAGYAAMYAARKYREANGLNKMVSSAAVAMLRRCVCLLLKGVAPDGAVGTPLKNRPMINDPVARGILHMTDIEDETAKTRTRTYELSSAQILMAVSSYGHNVLTLHTPDTYEYFCGSMFSFFLNAFTKYGVKLSAFVRMLDPEWGGLTVLTENKETDVTLNFSKAGDVFFVSKTHKMPYKANQNVLTDNKGTEDLRVQLVNSLLKEMKNSHVCVISPPQSSFADCFIVVGQCLFLLQCKRHKEPWNCNEKHMRDELHKMGFSTESKPLPATTQKGTEAENTALSNDFVSYLLNKLNLIRVIPVFCSSNGFVGEKRPKVTAYGYGLEVEPMFFSPNITLRLTFEMKNYHKKNSEWESNVTHSIPFPMEPKNQTSAGESH
ncbi:hypothetical protein STCU_12239 [Strigomonas culicis]|uniref:Uncharacterized protein n=1 Tax=Strigomonas culicis TaxID=28005 RepID=S9UXF6_9TRYP|nr:hypothetical protein STCU_12239 [Strigomonas culicis]|eukprot:EPY15215.1 hypothetical protein STCU_12239 [Strigomonas culicis]